MQTCQAPGCCNRPMGFANYCFVHKSYALGVNIASAQALVHRVLHETGEPPKPSLATVYPKYYKALPEGWTVVDTYAVNILFPVDDPSGCLLHARKKLLVPGVRSGGKSMRKDIQEARDTLNRWLELNPE